MGVKQIRQRREPFFVIGKAAVIFGLEAFARVAGDVQIPCPKRARRQGESQRPAMPVLGEHRRGIVIRDHRAIAKPSPHIMGAWGVILALLIGGHLGVSIKAVPIMALRLMIEIRSSSSQPLVASGCCGKTR